MKLIPWSFNNDHVQGYTVAGYQNGKLFDMGYRDDNHDEVLANRQALAAYLHTDLNHMVAPHQRHTTNFKKVTLAQDGGEGMYQHSTKLDYIDATYTRDHNLTLLTFHADCCPVLLYSEDQDLIAAIHSGWRGTVNEIVGKTASYLITHEGCNPSGFHAFIGPSLEQRNFGAMDDIIDLVKNMSFDTSSFYKRKDETHYLLDSKGLIKQQLLNLGVPDAHIEVSPYCTTEHDDLFFSYRKNKSPYRNITIITMKDRT